jgi:hypothetical protein
VVNTTDGAVARVVDVEVACGVHGNFFREGQRCAGGRATVAAIAAAAVSRDRGDNTGGGVDLADHVIAAIGDEDVSRGVDRDALGAAKVGRNGWPAVAGVTRTAVPDNRGDRIGAQELPLFEPFEAKSPVHQECRSPTAFAPDVLTPALKPPELP